MSSVKKRKIGSDTKAGPRKYTQSQSGKPKLIHNVAVSAFAARQKLWGTKSKEGAPAESTDEEQREAPRAQDILPNGPASTRKRKTPREAVQLPSSNPPAHTERPDGSRTGQGALFELSSDGVQEYVVFLLFMCTF